MELPRLAAALAVLLALLAPAAARAQPAPPQEVPLVGAIADRQSTQRQVLVAARANPIVAAALKRHPRALPRLFTTAGGGWQVNFETLDRVVAQVVLNDRTLRATEAWAGIQADWRMARGYEGAFGRRAASLPVWLLFALAFLLPFARPPWRLIHLDLAVLMALGVSFAFFSHGTIRASIPLAYPPLVYLLVRLLFLARRPAQRARILFSPDALLFGIVFLIGVRLALQVVSSNVIDVGYAGVIGADHITHGQALYGAFPSDNSRGDTYGPVNYLAYVPFELVWPWHGVWDDLPAGHAAAASFDLAAAFGLLRVGGRLLAYLWLACPWTLLIANSGSNDTLVGVLVLAAIIAPGARRGVALTTAVLTKFAPLALVPLLVRSRRTALAAAATLAALLLGVLVLDGSLHPFLDRTLGFQADRDSPFSLWGLYDLPTLQRVAQAGAVVLALVLARRRDRTLQSTCAAAAAILLAVQLGMAHWFYLYLGWFMAPALIALAGRSSGSIDDASPFSAQRITTPISHGSVSAGS